MSKYITRTTKYLSTSELRTLTTAVTFSVTHTSSAQSKTKGRSSEACLGPCQSSDTKVFKSGPSKIFLRLSFTNFTWSILKYFVSSVMELFTKIVTARSRFLQSTSRQTASVFSKNVLSKMLKRILNTAENTVISPNFLVQKFCGKVQFRYSFGWLNRNYAENCSFPQNFYTRKLGKANVFYAVKCTSGLRK